MSKATEAPDAMRKGFRLPLAWTIGLVVLALGTCTLLVLTQLSSSRRAGAIARIRASGAPVYPEDIVVPPPGPGKDPTDWLRQMEECELWDSGDLVKFYSIGELPRPDGPEASQRALATLQAAKECLTGDGFASESTREEEWEQRVVELARARVYRPRAWQDLDDCEQALLEAEVSGYEPCMALALQGGSYARIDQGRLIGDALASRAPFMEVQPFRPLLIAVWTQLAAALRSAIDGQGDLAVERVVLALETCRMWSGSPMLIAALLGDLQMRSALRELRVVLALLPSTIDTRPIEDALVPLDPRRALRTALHGERAWALGLFRSGQMTSMGEMGWRSLPYRLFAGRDQNAYLELMEELLSWLDEDTWVMLATRRSAGQIRSELPFYAVAADSMVPASDSTVDGFLESEVDLLLTRGALLARREGFEAGAAWAAATTDPFSGAPLQSRIEPDGSFTLWSVGPDGVDDGVPEPPPGADSSWESPDLFWRLRKP